MSSNFGGILICLSQLHVIFFSLHKIQKMNLLTISFQIKLGSSELFLRMIQQTITNKL